MGKKRVAKVASPGRSVLAELGLKPDQGWASLLADDLAAMPEGPRIDWLALVGHASRVESVSGQPWSEVHKGWTDKVAAFGFGHVDDERMMRGIKVSLKRGLGAFSATENWVAACQALIEAVGGMDAFAERLADWLAAGSETKPGALNQASMNRETLRGLLLMWDGEDDVAMDRLRGLGVHALKKRTAAGTMIAARLTQFGSVSALGQMVLLRDKATSHSARGMFDLLIEIVSERTGVLPGDALEAVVPNYGLSEIGNGSDALGDFTAEHWIQDSDKIVTVWHTPQGKKQKSVPAEVRRTFKKELKVMQAGLKDAKAMLASQRDRIERLYMERRSWSYPAWRRMYADHELVGTLARRLLWVFDRGDASDLIVGLPSEVGIEDVAGKGIAAFDEATCVALWHPIGDTPETIFAWRERLAEKRLVQPFKQAHREVYLLTDAERQTGTYSNRFAGHVLKQSQFRAVAKSRGWHASLLGYWDGGQEPATRRCGAFTCSVELHLSVTGEEATPSGGALYVATDRVCFELFDRLGESVPLDHIDPIVFSEVMRDVDLFVGVASVGNDPNWQDGGPEGRYRDYWHSYSFGDLGATSKTRKDILERLVPRLKIAERCSFDHKFLIVRGDKRTYKIHLGSSNILMEPNDQYLCIVPGRGDTKLGDKVFLPFEGDQRLAVILSKAMMLAEDAKIKDPTILSQIKR